MINKKTNTNNGKVILVGVKTIQSGCERIGRRSHFGIRS